MRILLTGAAGFIGSTLAEALLQRGDEVTGLDSFDPYYDPAQKRANLRSAEASPGFRLVEGDIRDRELVRSLMDERPDALVHLAARAGVRPSIAEPATYADVNVTGTAVLLEHAARAGVPRIVFASSSSVYGADSPEPFRTDARAVQPVSPYAATKRAGELLCSSFCAVHDLGIASLRYFTVYGPRQRPDMAIMKFIRLVDEGRPIPVFGDGSSRRDFTFVTDAVAGTIAALDWTATSRGHRPFNIGGASTITLSGLIDAVGRAVGKPVTIERSGDQPGDVPLTHADVSETRDVLGWRPAVGLDEGLARQVAWHRSR
jgi:UDP-glucuronate 4-epimerase